MTIFLATLAGWLNRKQHDVIMYLNAENVKEQLEKKGVKLKLSNAQRYKLAKRGKKLGRKGLMEYASIVTPDTILAWHRKLIALKYTAKRMLRTDRQQRMEVLQGLCVQTMANPNGRIQGALFNPMSNLSEVREILSRISFLGGLEGDAFERMMGYFEPAAFKAGECIIRKGESPAHIYIIQSGSVELRITDGATNLRKREFVVGDHFGEVAMLSMVNDTASFFAAEGCQLITLSRKSLAQLSKEEPLIFRQLILNLARDLARKVQYSDELLLRVGDV